MTSLSQPSHFDDDSSDDELLLKPQLRVSATKRGSTEPLSTPEGSSNDAATSTPKVTQSPQRLEEKALKDAKFYVNNKLDYKGITKPSMLKWYIYKPKFRNGRQTKSDVKHNFVPCYVCPNAEEAMAGWSDVKLTSTNNTLVRFLGRCYTDSNKIQPVAASKLLDYNHVDGDEKDDTMALQPLWSPLKMTAHLQSLRNQTDMKGDDQELKLRTEELILSMILQMALDKEQDLARGVHEEVSVAAEVDDSCDEEMDHDANPPTVSLSSPRPSSPRVVETSGNERRSTRAPPNLPVDTAKPRLRAGDVIEHYPPHLVAHRDNLERATIVNCFPSQNGVALELSNGTFVPRDHQVRLLRKYGNGVYKDVANSRFVSLRHCIVDSRHNGTVQVETLADHVGKIYENMRQEAQICQTGDEAPDAETTTMADRSKSPDGKPVPSTSTATKQAPASPNRPCEPISAVGDEMGKQHETNQSEVNPSGVCPTDGVSPSAETATIVGHSTSPDRKAAPQPKKAKQIKTNSTDVSKPPRVVGKEKENQRETNKSQADPSAKQQPQLPKSRVRKAVDPPNDDRNPDLEQMLRECTESRKRRRANYSLIETRETALQTAIAVRQRLDQSDDKDDLLEQCQEVSNCSRERVWDFLNGNSQNLIPAALVLDMSNKFKEWLNQPQVAE